MKEYGGYIELDELHGKEYYSDCLLLNSGRSCLGYLIEKRGIEKIYLPYFLCDTVKETCEKYHVDYEFYCIAEDFKPVFDKVLGDKEYLYVVNFYGQLNVSYVKDLQKKFKNLIFDNAQDFFRRPLPGMDTIYICRKFFGVADGAYLFTEDNFEAEYPVDTCYDRMTFLLGRYEKDASSFYSEYVENNDYFANKPVMRASRLTKNLLKAINYNNCKKQRTENYKYLHTELEHVNLLQLEMIEGAFAYPLLVKDGRLLKKKLIEKKIYVPTLWPDVINKCSEDTIEYKYAMDIIPIPVDQRYDVGDMKYICDALRDEL